MGRATNVVPTPAPTPTATLPDVEGLDLGTLQVGKTRFDEARAVSRDARSVFFTHRSGMASARLRDLPAEVQTRLGYDPLNPPPEPTPAPAPVMTAARRVSSPDRVRSASQRLDRLFLALGTPAPLAQRQSLREEFAQLDLSIKNQGRRPSCAIYAITSALEFQFFQIHGRSEHFSEEYLIWATRRSLGLVGQDGIPTRDARGEFAADAGYAIPSVVGALATYGVALETEMPPASMDATAPLIPPDSSLVDRSRLRRSVFVAQLPGRRPDALLNNLVHALNARMPVPAAIAWPSVRVGGGRLDRQPTLSGAYHAVTFLGYECPSGRPEDAVFIFKNSYGESWGDHGYGYATWHYLSQHLREAYVLDVRALAEAPRW